MTFLYAFSHFPLTIRGVNIKSVILENVDGNSFTICPMNLDLYYYILIKIYIYKYLYININIYINTYTELIVMGLPVGGII